MTLHHHKPKTSHHRFLATLLVVGAITVASMQDAAAARPCNKNNPCPTPTPTPTATATPTPTPTATATPTPTTTPPPSAGREVGSYFTQWGIYRRNYLVKNVATSGSAAKLTFINYAFSNVYEKNGGYECDIFTKAESGDGTGGDAFADYTKGFRASDSVDGIGDEYNQPLAGNFNQLKKLKALYPNIKVFISLGGWSWSRWFSAASATDALRKQLVSSCINVLIKGNLPIDGYRGGLGAAKGVFDGIDIDWEFPGGGGQPYNSVSPADKQNFTLLLAEFRRQLDAQGTVDGKRYLLTVAVGAGKDKIDNTEPALYSQHLDWVNAMTYDFHGAWDAQGPTNFHSHLYTDAADPSTGFARVSGNDAINYLIASGVPANKLVLGLPFYGRGWTGVSAGPNGDGLYQSASGPARGTWENGIEDYKVLIGKSGTRRYHPVTKQLSLYTGTEWWSYDDATVIATKVNYVKSNGLRGVFSWELSGDDANATLLKASAVVNQQPPPLE